MIVSNWRAGYEDFPSATLRCKECGLRVPAVEALAVQHQTWHEQGLETDELDEEALPPEVPRPR